ncbi:MAG: glycerol kinase [Cellvibrionaceae bacterium]|jgi:glycerol kinase
MQGYLLSIDQGTTSTRAILFDQNGNVCCKSQLEFPQHFPDSGWVEHDSVDLLQTSIACCRQVLEDYSVSSTDIIAIGITNQRETTIVWDKNTGKAVYNAIVWQDRRTSEYCQQLKNDGLEANLTKKTGLLADPYFSATKIKWILDNVPGARAQAEQGDLLFGTVDSFLLWHLSGGKEHKTDATNASRTLLFNIHEQCWDEELLTLFNIPASMMPKVMDSADEFGVTQADIFGSSIPVMAMAGDQQAALFGQTCFEPGMAKSTYGTGCFLMLNTGDTALISENQLLTTVAYRLKGEVTFALEGSIFVAGAAMQWLRDGLKLIQKIDEVESLARETPLAHGVYMVPAFTGLGAPYWDPDARGAIFGLTRKTGIKEIVTAGLQSVCYQTKDLQKSMEVDGVRPVSLRVDGGMVANEWFLQFLADILGARVDVPTVIETTAQGVAFMAGLQAGVFSSLDHIKSIWKLDASFEPKMAKSERDEFYQGWQQSVLRVRSEFN